MPEFTDQDADDCFEAAVTLVKEAGRLIKSCILSKDKAVEQKSNITDLVTETDQAVEKLLVEGLSSRFPGHKFIGEETTAAQGNSDFDFTDHPTWIIDPIDGTMNFVHCHPMVSVSVGLVVNKTPVIGIVYAPMLDALYTAKKGRGAFLNGAPIKVSGCQEMEKALLIMEVWAQQVGSSSAAEKNQIHNFATVLPRFHAFRCVGSAAINLALVAAGQADVYAQVGIRCWDIVAGALLVKEAGGVVLDPRDGSDFDYMNRAVLTASTPALAKEVLDLGLKYSHYSREHPEAGRL